MGGDMCALIREVAEESFFAAKLGFPNTRYQYLEVAAKFLLIEKTIASGGGSFADLKKKFLDKMVTDGRQLATQQKSKLKNAVTVQLRSLARIFGRKDPCLGDRCTLPLYYLFVKQMEQEYAHRSLYAYLKNFIQRFHTMRQANLGLPEDQRDPSLTEFGRLIQQGTNDIGSLETRVVIMRRFLRGASGCGTTRPKTRVLP